MSWSSVSLPTICRPKQWPTIPKAKLLSLGYPVFGANGPIGYYSEYNHEEPTILITCRGATCGSINVCDPKSYVTGNAMALDALDESQADLRFLVHALASADFSGVITGVAQPQITRQSLARLRIPLPPLAEQKRIAGILDAADALRAKRRESLAQLDTLLQFTFLDMFDDKGAPLSIGKMLSEGILKVHKDGNHGSLYPRAHEFGERGIPFLSAKCISEEGSLLQAQVQFLNEDKARTLKIGWIEGGDVLLAHNASVGKTFLYNGEFDQALIGTSLTAFRPDPDTLDSAYLLGALRSHGFQLQLLANMGQTTRNQVPITAQRRLSIPLPPFDLQRRFSAVFRSVELQKTSQRAHLAELDTLFASLQSRAFRGDL